MVKEGMKMLNKYFILLIMFSISLFAQIGQIVALKGDVELLRDSVKSKLVIKDKILEKDYISTLDNSRTQILLEDKTIITIGENSQFDVQNYLFENNDNNKSNADFNFIKGTFRIITGEIGKINPKKFNLETKSSSIGIRGTEIFLELDPEKEKVICTQGTIEVKIKKTDELVVLNVGEFLTIDLKTDKLTVEKITTQAQVPSFSSSNSTKVDKKYDEWTEEKNSKDKDPVVPDPVYTIGDSLNDAFSKGHTVDYTATKLSGTIDEVKDGLTSFDLTNATFDLSIDFGKARDDSPVTSKISIDTATQTSVTRNLTGNIDDSNKINLSYDVKKTGTSNYIRENAIGNLEFKNTALDIQGNNLELRTQAQDEEIKINEVEFTAK
jgi:hypothetical protein